MPFSRGYNLPITSAKEQFSMKYVGLLCADAGIPFHETPTGLDFFGIDATIKIPEVSLEVQVKATNSLRPLSSGEIYWIPKESWIKKWNMHVNPIYLLYIHILKEDDFSWLSTEPDMLKLHAVGYWVRYEPQEDTSSIFFPSENIISTETVQNWIETNKRGYGA